MPEDEERQDAGHPETDPELLELHEVLELTGERDDGGATGETIDPLATD
jgi:hypothetical protein